MPLKKASSSSFSYATQALIAALVLVCSAPLSARESTFTPEFTAKVIYVDDGDTVAVLWPDNSKVKVRLANIDAPESEHGRCRPSQPWAAQSTKFLKDMVGGRTLMFKCSTLDRYGRHVCDILVDQTTASRALAEAGLAWANRASPSYLKDRVVADLERSAQASGRGLWQDKSAVAPWLWRRGEWDHASGCSAAKGASLD